jgi:hypothetical protein
MNDRLIIVVNEHVFVWVIGRESIDHLLCVCTLRLVHPSDMIEEGV